MNFGKSVFTIIPVQIVYKLTKPNVNNLSYKQLNMDHGWLNLRS